MSMEVSGGVELREDIARMADLLRASGENGSRACNWILQNAAQPVLEQMLHNASTDPKRRTGTLLRSIKIGRVVKKALRRLSRHGGHSPKGRRRGVWKSSRIRPWRPTPGSAASLRPPGVRRKGRQSL